MHAVLERVVSQISSEVRGLDAETTQLHPNDLAYKWSAQQVVEHLVLGYRLTSSALETRLNKGRAFPQPKAHLSAMVAAVDDSQLSETSPGGAGTG